MLQEQNGKAAPARRLWTQQRDMEQACCTSRFGPFTRGCHSLVRSTGESASLLLYLKATLGVAGAGAPLRSGVCGVGRGAGRSLKVELHVAGPWAHRGKGDALALLTLPLTSAGPGASRMRLWKGLRGIQRLDGSTPLQSIWVHRPQQVPATW